MRIEYLLQKCINDTSLRQIRKLFLEAVLKLFDLTPRRLSDPTPVRTLDLGSIPMQLSPQPPQLPIARIGTPEMATYCDLLAQSPIPFDIDLVNMWSTLDSALCSNRFANLEKLKVDYVIFDTRAIQDPVPENYERIVRQLVAPSDWFALTKHFFPKICLSSKIRLEGRLL